MAQKTCDVLRCVMLKEHHYFERTPVLSRRWPQDSQSVRFSRFKDRVWGANLGLLWPMAPTLQKLGHKAKKLAWPGLQPSNFRISEKETTRLVHTSWFESALTRIWLQSCIVRPLMLVKWVYGRDLSPIRPGLDSEGLRERYGLCTEAVWRIWPVAISAECQPLNNEFTSFEAIGFNSNFEFTQMEIFRQKLH